MTRDRDILWSTGRDESVETNQRALIDKVLARYSGKFTVFRELLQNSDDAQSSKVEIHFETSGYLRRKDGDQGDAVVPPLPDLKSTHVAQWTFRNNGFAFRDEDWSRLRKIAEGNPDVEKIGAFGVGFYSLFSMTEKPFVSSGGYAMQFYWKDSKDQLIVRRGDLPSKGNADQWTTFEMTLRETGPIPPAFELMQFLASSITFMVHLNDVAVYFDEYRIGYIKKLPGVTKDVDLPTTMQRSSGLKIMHISAVQSHSVRIEAAIVHAVTAVGSAKTPLLEVSGPPRPKGGFFSSVVSALASQSTPPVFPTPPKDPTELHKMSVTLVMFTAEVDVKVDEKLSSDLLRSTKKNPPAHLKYHLIYTGKDEYDKSVAGDKNQLLAWGGIFQGLRADLNGSVHTRIFIGHATGQTTGIGGHMASNFIPTVEREAIDFVDKNIAIAHVLAWNKELLYVGGFLSRTAYESELSNIDAAWTTVTESTPSQELKNRLQDQFLHTLKFFAFHHSTPSSEVGQLLEAAFYRCSTAPLSMLSTIGVRKASDIKQYDQVFTVFLKDVPMLPSSVIHKCGRTVKMLQDQRMVSPITFSDVLHNLSQHQLNKEKLVSCLQWWIGLNEDSSDGNMARLLDAIVFRHVDGSSLRLSSIKCFADPRILGGHIPEGSPLPNSLLPQVLAEQFTVAQLSSFGWQEFTVVNWLQYISRTDIMAADLAHDFTKSPDWAARVLSVLSRVRPTLSNDARNAAKKLFANKTCIPTSRGLCTPEESYLPGTSTGLFRDLELSMVQFPDGLKITGEIEALLLSIGVRKHVDPQLILKRMKETGTWDIPGLIRYLAHVRKFLTPGEVIRLQSSPIFSKESILNDTTHYCARDLYAPIEIFRQLQLPVIRWDEGSKWFNGSDEAELLFHLGLQYYPPLERIVGLCSSKDAAVRDTAFWYLCDGLISEYPSYDARDFGHVAFIPAENNNGYHLAKPGDVFSDSQWKALGFSVVPDGYREAPTRELGIQPHPSPSVLLSHLEKTRPPNKGVARQWFEILFEQIPAFGSAELVRLSKLPIVPTNGAGKLEWLAPAKCYLGEGTQDIFYSKLFAFVNFGPSANRFLTECGSRNEPTVADVAESLVDNPNRFYELADGDENFLAQLRILAVNKHRIPNLTLSRMKFGSILLGKKGVGPQTWNRHTIELRSPKEILIADDINAHRLFRDAIFIAPQDELLEDFYAYLGCKRLSEVVEEQCEVDDEIPDAKTCSEKRALVLDRLTIFLHEYTYGKPKVSVAELSDADNFQVKICKKLSISKTLVTDKTKRSQDVSAGARWVEKGRMELWLSDSAELDMYDVSTSLCRLLFGTAKVSESLLFTSILSEKLEVLRRRGCNVDLILKRRQPEQNEPIIDNEIKCDITDQEVSKSSAISQLDHPSQAPQSRVMIPETAISSASLEPPRPAQPSPSPVTELEASTASSSSLNLYPTQTCESGVVEPEASESSTALKYPHIVQASSSYASEPEGSRAARCQKHKSHPGGGWKRFLRGRPSRRDKTTVMPVQSLRPQQDVISPSVILKHVDMAIQACNSKDKSIPPRPNNMECHCNASGQVDNLVAVGELPVGTSLRVGKRERVTVFATKDSQHLDTFMAFKQEPLDRFADIIVPIANMCKLSTSSLNIFYDERDRAPIAFNDNRKLFLNLRYFEAWHYQDVAKGDRQQAQISWFFALAHEIAHNLVKEHDSEYAFWFSATCQACISALAQILRPTDGR